MGKNGFLVVGFICILVSTTFTASIAVHLRKLGADETGNSSASGNSTNQLNKNPPDDVKKSTELPKPDQKDNTTLPADSKNTAQNSTAGNPPTGKDSVDNVNPKGVNQNLGVDDNCLGHRACAAKELVACVKPSENGSALFLVVQNNGKSDLKVNVSFSDHVGNPLPPLDVRKHKAESKGLPSFVDSNTKIVLKSGQLECVLGLSRPISVDNLIRQLSFYSKQMTPVHAVYGSFLLVLLFGGTWACCKLRKRNREKGIPYQELEMGVPESMGAANVDATEGWDHDWDDDDWDDDVAVKSPTGLQARNVSADGLTSRSPPRKDGWEIDWED